MKTQKRAILYARVAAIDTSQKPDRLKFQTDCLMVYCQDNQIEIVGAYSEVASGTNFERKEFQKLLKALKTGKLKADLLLFTKWDRFTRDILFTGKNMVKELEALGIRPQAINDSVGSEAILKIVKRLKR
ncbi:MAG: recombinase family protein [Bacteroidia bacterium]|nr:recombinase family protein [Bacteroidia bacterium]